ncbi:uncharacterized protein AB675_1851 [Cyphellophora attinorum]|uniref:Transcription factor domain-containing protein n=1 Tax=Cyphellophora attinorum TaxID=1664694 RepID=A0A0N0NPY4_9EURO|nr:uncharacterized protein AB675_1851 [Phialophora attinorum]KPI43059.1 hypothetical protein AB675_1851 [Phialophora attinorum]
MDRLVSYACWRPQTIDVDCVSINLPCPENVFTLDEPFKTPTLTTLPYPCEATRFGLSPYFITALEIWSQATYIQILGGLRHVSRVASTSVGAFDQLSTRLEAFNNSMPGSMQWSTPNRRAFRHIHQEGLFIHLHLTLLNTACIVNQESLPYPAEGRDAHRQGLLSDESNGTGTDQERSVTACVRASTEIVAILQEARNSDLQATNQLQSVVSAFAMLSAANVQLWIQYVQSRDRNAPQHAEARVESIIAMLESWKMTWPVAEDWLNTIRLLRRLYEATYAPISGSSDGQHLNNVADPPAQAADDAQDRPVARLIEGNGLPDFKERLVDKLRFTLLSSLEDMDARKRVLKPSMTTGRDQVELPASEIDEFEYWVPESYDFGLPDLYLSNTWPGLESGHLYAPDAV